MTCVKPCNPGLMQLVPNCNPSAQQHCTGARLLLLSQGLPLLPSALRPVPLWCVPSFLP
jgi:hypothetical protein